MLLQDVLHKVAIRSVSGSTSVEIKDLCIDSREVKTGAVFIAIKGSSVDGHRFIEQSIERGAQVIVCEGLTGTEKEGVTYVFVDDSSVAAGLMAHVFFGKPSEQLRLIGITGTNGKTTIATLLYKLFTRLGYTCGLISTIQNIVGSTQASATHTTPDAVSLNRLLRDMVEAGCTHAFMETSSHALHQNRVAGVQYSGGVFSNITHDHLDYHGSFDEYIRVKKSFFDSLPATAFALSNLDDKRGKVMLQNSAAKKKYYSLKTSAEFKGKILENSLNGLHMMVNDMDVHFRLIGAFNAYNLLAVWGAAVCLGENSVEVLTALSELSGAEGRFDYMVSAKEKIIVIVDYAHTPDALLNVLATVHKLKSKMEQVITVVGCGGDRDKTKRPVMAQVACTYSDRVIFTSDNPRSEDPGQIILDMEQGVQPAHRRKYISIADRKEAIKTAISLAKAEDIILVAGKGHEKYQEIKGERKHFDDKEVVRAVFEALEK